MCNEPGSGLVKQRTEAICPGPAQGIEPTIQPKLCDSIRELHVPNAFPDFHGVVPTLPPRAVVHKAVGLADTQLPAERRKNGGRGFRQVFRE